MHVAWNCFLLPKCGSKLKRLLVTYTNLQSSVMVQDEEIAHNVNCIVWQTHNYEFSINEG